MLCSIIDHSVRHVKLAKIESVSILILFRQDNNSAWEAIYE